MKSIVFTFYGLFSSYFLFRCNKYSRKSILLLQKSGIDFDSHKWNGIHRENFSEMFLRSGLICGDNVFVTFGGGYDIAYLLKLLTNKSLPVNRYDFLKLSHDFFPKCHDVKYWADCMNIKGGLQRISGMFKLSHAGPQHQAGTDAHLTGVLFNEFKKVRTTLN